jgi:predicted 3-demethylubiquinone-9 3-methyltransferase (glyoxalase superfamily)
MQKITPFLWFDGRIEEAVGFYRHIFANCQVLHQSAQDATLELEGQRLVLFNGGKHFALSPAFSLFVDCQTQAEIDRLFAELTKDGGAGSRCGWLTDKFGVSWQLVPSGLRSMLQDPDPEKASRVREAMLQMDKLDVARLEQAYAGQ